MPSRTLVFLILSPLLGFSQTYKPFIEPGKQFTIANDVVIGPSIRCNYHLHFSGDSLFSGLTYKVLHIQGHCTHASRPFDHLDQAYFLLREDTIQQKVFAVNLFDTSQFKGEYLLWDYQVQPGDTLRTRSLDGTPRHYQIDNVGSIILFTGESARTYYGKTSQQTNSRLLYTEGVINSEEQLLVNYNGVCNWGEQKTLLYHKSYTPYLVCDTNRYVGSTDLNAPIDFLQNPVSTHLRIKLSQASSLSLYSLNGELILQRSLIKGSYEIPLAGLKPGIYTLLVNGQAHKLMVLSSL